VSRARSSFTGMAILPILESYVRVTCKALSCVERRGDMNQSLSSTASCLLSCRIKRATTAKQSVWLGLAVAEHTCTAQSYHVIVHVVQC
jgi:hypothetical protein